MYITYFLFFISNSIKFSFSNKSIIELNYIIKNKIFSFIYSLQLDTHSNSLCLQTHLKFESNSRDQTSLLVTNTHSQIHSTTE